MSCMVVFLFSLIVLVLQSNVEAQATHCRSDNDCLRSIDPPCFCVHLNHICGCPIYGIGVQHISPRNDFISQDTEEDESDETPLPNNPRIVFPDRIYNLTKILMLKINETI